jgi:hypothetical protein
LHTLHQHRKTDRLFISSQLSLSGKLNRLIHAESSCFNFSMTGSTAGNTPCQSSTACAACPPAFPAHRQLFRAMLFAPVKERRLPFLIKHVIEYICALTEKRDSRDLAANAAGRGINDKIELTIGKIVKRYRAHAAGMGKQRRQLFCTGKGSVGNGHGTVQRQRQQNAPRCATRTNQQDPESGLNK